MLCSTCCDKPLGRPCCNPWHGRCSLIGHRTYETQLRFISSSWRSDLVKLYKSLQACLTKKEMPRHHSQIHAAALCAQMQPRGATLQHHFCKVNRKERISWNSMLHATPLPQKSITKKSCWYKETWTGPVASFWANHPNNCYGAHQNNTVDHLCPFSKMIRNILKCTALRCCLNSRGIQAQAGLDVGHSCVTLSEMTKVSLVWDLHLEYMYIYMY